MSASKSHTGLRGYLQQTGVLESGDDALIKKVKAAYWRDYFKKYKREKRGKDKEYSVSLDPTERKHLEQEAKRHRQSISQFIKQSAWSYIHKTYLIPSKADLAGIEQLISSCHTELVQLRKSKVLEEAFEEKMLSCLNSIEATLTRLASEPECLEDTILKTLRDRPHYIETLKTVIEAYDNKIKR